MTERLLLYLYPWILEALLAGWAVLVCVNAPAIVATFKPKVTKSGLIAAGLIFAAALVVRLAVFPPRHQVYFDEFIHEDIAGNVARDNAFGETLAGGSDEYRELKRPAWPGGYHVMLGELYKFTGANETAAFRFNAFLASSTVLLVYFLAALLFSDENAGLLGALLLCALPVHVRFSGTTDLTACSLFWIGISLLSLTLCFHRKSHPMLMLFLFSALYAANVRFENLILFPLAGMLFLGSPKQFPIMTKRQSLFAAALLSTLAPVVAILVSNRRDGLLGYSTPVRAGFEALAHNVPANLLYLLGAPALILAPAIAAGLTRAAGKEAVWTRRLLVLGAAYLFLCAFHTRGDFHVGSSERLSLPIFLALIVAAGGGFKLLFGRIRRKAVVSAAILAAFVAVNRSSYGQLPLERYEAEYRFITEAAPALPSGSYVLTYCAPLIVSLTKNPAVSALMIPPGAGAILDELDRGGRRPLVLFKDVWWYKFSEQSGPLEEYLKRRYAIEPLRVADIDAKEYGFYILTRKP